MALLRVKPHIVDSVANFVFNTATITSNLTSGNASLGNLAEATYFSGTLITNAQPNITSVGTLTSLNVSGNVTASYILGNGSQLTGLPASYTNANVAAYLPTYTGNFTAGNANISGTLTVSNFTTSGTTGNISGANYISANYFVGNGSLLTGLPASYSNANVATYLPTYTGNLTPGNLTITTHANLGDVANITIAGGTSGQLLSTDGNGVMSWSSPQTSTITTDMFTGDGANTEFTLSVSPANVNMITVNYNGSVLLKDSYSIAGNVLTLGSAPFTGAKLEVISITNLAGAAGATNTTSSKTIALNMFLGF